MGMKIEIYNAHQIGGCFTVITTSRARIMIDYGLALPGAKKKQEKFDWKKNKVDALFITHYHGDHVGGIFDIPDKDVPIYMGSTARKIMWNIHSALAKVPELRKEEAEKVALLSSDRIQEIKENGPIEKIPGIKITPYSVDHSAYDAYMYLIEADGKVALHTGDFRGHGFRGEAILGVIKKYVHEKGRKVDYLITEGTMIGDRQFEECLSETELEEKAKGYFKDNRYVFLVVSSTNLDSLASFYRAAKEFNMETYCYNSYVTGQLNTFSSTAGVRSSHYRFENIHTLNLDGRLRGELWENPAEQERNMRENGFLCIIKPGEAARGWIERFADKNPLVVYSMWDGYIDKKSPAHIPEWMEFARPFQENKCFVQLHTSGHASAEMIEKVIETVAPREEIIPMHTEHPEGFLRLNIGEKYKKMITIKGKTIVKKRVEELSPEKQEALKAIVAKEHRYVGDKSKENYGALFDAFVNPKGMFYQFNRFAKDPSKDLVVALRGNSGSSGTIIIYYCNHVVWELSIGGKENDPDYKVRFNYNHARYYAAEDCLEPFRRLVAEKEPEFKIDKDGRPGIGYIQWCRKKGQPFEEEWINAVYKDIMAVMKSYFNIRMKEDQFRKKAKVPMDSDGSKPSYVEKRWQQRLFQYMKSTAGKEETDVFAYDLEFSQKFKDSSIRSEIGVNEPDILALRFRDGKPEKLLLIEVKSTKSACISKTSGISPHLEGMKRYSQEELFMESRIGDVWEILKQYQKMGLYPQLSGMDMDSFRGCLNWKTDIERVLLLTNHELPEDEMTREEREKQSALEYYKARKNEVNKLARAYQCSIWITTNNYFDKEISIKPVDTKEK